MRTQRWQLRLLSALTAAALLAAFGGEAFGYRRPCAHHEAMAGHEQHREASPSTGHHATHAQDTSEEEGHAEPCSCLGNCSVAHQEAPPRGGAEVALQAPVARISVRPAPTNPVVPARIAHLIPFAQAPPLA
jgi:hypothetical protein